MRFLIILSTILFSMQASAQTWIDSLDNYARNSFLRPQQYFWTWRNAPLLHAMEFQYELSTSEEDKEIYLQYVKTAMDRNLLWANGVAPNSVASGNGMAFLYRIFGESIYKRAALNVYYDYLEIMRTNNGGVSHLAWTPELWDDTVYMIGVTLLAMYRASGDEKYLTELIEQYKIHKEKLLDETTGLWVHAWDGNNTFLWDFCSEFNWADPETRRSSELWGRGNGWVVVTLSELLNNMDEDHEEWDYISNSLKEMIENLPAVQDQTTGHWYQLPFRNTDPDNYLESSSTAMFAYGILTALKYDIVAGDEFEDAIHAAYYGLKEYSTSPIGDPEKGYLTTQNVCTETCIGNADYYFNIPTSDGRAYALAMFIIFGRSYQKIYLDDVPTAVNSFTNSSIEFQLYPTLIDHDRMINISISSIEDYDLVFEVVDIQGRVLSRKTQSILKGENNQNLQLPDLQSGEYFLILKNESDQQLTAKPFFVK